MTEANGRARPADPSGEARVGLGGLPRCPWASQSELMRHYHDTEWGVPALDDRVLFEFLVLEAAQAGLSWELVLRRRHAYRQVFLDFDIPRVACFGPSDVERILSTPGIIRNRRKVEGAVSNARAALAVAESHGTLAAYLWQFVGGRPVQNHWTSPEQVPATTPLASALCADLRRQGFVGLGPVVTYAFMQAVGMVNDHLVTCFRHSQVSAVGSQAPGGACPEASRIPPCAQGQVVDS